uniref:hypothetical protein n=1 Tax=Pedobacter schmidteae TaxID=2201271 RepID=UPI000EB1E961|nr:hypothetical protein [Pedobacter schmidteae]
METNPIADLTKLARSITKYSFLIGTALFLIYCFSRFSDLIYLGFFFLVMAFILNLFMLLIVLTVIIAYPKHYQELLKTAAVMLLNLPVAAFYFWVLTEVPFFKI